MDCSLPGSSVHGILQAIILKWVAVPSSRDLPDPGIEPVSLTSPVLAGRLLTTSATSEGSLAESLPGKERSLLPFGLCTQGRVGDLILLLSQFYLFEVSVY